MIDSKKYFDCLKDNEIDFFSGVPDSLLKELCFCITDNSNDDEHVICANEGNSIGLSIGYNLATGKIPLVYLQNSGLGNIINPYLSLSHESVFSIPILLIIGWRGQPGIKDEPQHEIQGKISKELLKILEIEHEILLKDSDKAIKQTKRIINKIKKNQKSIAILVEKNSFTKYKFMPQDSSFKYRREFFLEILFDNLNKKDIVVTTTGKTSRESFEIFKKNKYENPIFYSIGGMGHSNQIAFGISKHTSNRVFCLDGDGALIMHMGSAAIIGSSFQNNFIHVLLNNGTHESVGSQPTVGLKINFSKVFDGFNYKNYFRVESGSELKKVLTKLDQTDKGPTLIEIFIASKSRTDLSRPSKSPKEQKEIFIEKYNSNNLK